MARKSFQDFYDTTKTFTYTLEIPSIPTQTIDVILPFMDVPYWNEDLITDTRATEVTVKFAAKSIASLPAIPTWEMVC